MTKKYTVIVTYKDGRPPFVIEADQIFTHPKKNRLSIPEELDVPFFPGTDEDVESVTASINPR